MRRTPRDDRGVSSVIGAILVVGLIVAITITVRVNYVPLWSQEREAIHSRSVFNQMGALKAELDREVDNRSTIAYANPIDMGLGRGNTFGAGKIADQLRLEGPARSIVFGAPQMVLYEQDGQTFESFSESWSTVTSNAEVANVFDVQSMRLKIAEIKRANTGDDVTVSIYDAGGALAGTFKFAVIDAGGADYLLYNTITDAAGTVLVNNPLSQHNNAVLSPYWVDVMDSTYRFDQLLAAAVAPMTLRITENGLDAEFSLTYSIYSNGQVITAGGGRTVPFFSRTHEGPSLVYANVNEHFVPQTLILEHGAILLDQGDAQTMRVEPIFTAALVGNVTNIMLVVPTLTGTDQTLTGEGAATVYTTPYDRRSYIGRAAMFTITLESAYPALWADFWSERMLAIPGFVSGTHFLASSTATSASLQVFGTASDAGSNHNDLYVTIRQATIQTHLRG